MLAGVTAKMQQLFDYCSTRLLRKFDIRKRLMVSFLALALLPLLISGSISFVESSKAVEKNTRIFSTEIVKQVAKSIALQMAKIDADSEALVLSDRVQAILTNYSGDNAAEKAKARDNLTFVLLNAYGSFNYYNQKYFLDADRHIIAGRYFRN